MIITSLDTLKAAARELGDLMTKIARAAQAEAEALAKIQGDNSRSASWKAEQTAAIRKDSKTADMLAEMRTRWAEMQEYRDLWTTPLLVLSRQPVNPASGIFTGNADQRTAIAADEAAIRMNFRAELAAMPRGVALLATQEAAMTRNWWKVYEAALVLDRLPLDLSELPIEDLELAESAFYLAEAAVRQAEIDAEEVRGIQTTTKKIALGLLTERYERAKAARMAGWKLNLDEVKAAGLDKPPTGSVLEQLTPKPFTMTIPTGGPDSAGGGGE